jgi:hypothetical protein
VYRSTVSDTSEASPPAVLRRRSTQPPCFAQPARATTRPPPHQMRNRHMHRRITREAVRSDAKRHTARQENGDTSRRPSLSILCSIDCYVKLSIERGWSCRTIHPVVTDRASRQDPPPRTALTRSYPGMAGTGPAPAQVPCRLLASIRGQSARLRDHPGRPRRRRLGPERCHGSVHG